MLTPTGRCFPSSLHGAGVLQRATIRGDAAAHTVAALLAFHTYFLCHRNQATARHPIIQSVMSQASEEQVASFVCCYTFYIVSITAAGLLYPSLDILTVNSCCLMAASWTVEHCLVYHGRSSFSPR